MDVSIGLVARYIVTSPFALYRWHSGGGTREDLETVKVAWLKVQLMQPNNARALKCPGRSAVGIWFMQRVQ
jgi:hypothetical protein